MLHAVTNEIGERSESRRLSDSRRDSSFAQHRSERMSQSMNVDRAASVVALGNAARFQVAVENLAERLRDFEQLGCHRNVRRPPVKIQQRVALKRDLSPTPEAWPFSSARWYAARKSVGVALSHIDE